MKKRSAFLRSCLFVVMLLALAVPGLEVKAVPPPANTWTGAVSTDWSTGGNWSLGTVPCTVPGVCEAVVIPATACQPIVSTNPGACGNLTINTGAKLTIQNGFDIVGSLTVNGVLILQDPGGSFVYLDVDTPVIVNAGGKIVLGPNRGRQLRHRSPPPAPP